MEFSEWKEILFLRMELCVCTFKKFITLLSEKKETSDSWGFKLFNLQILNSFFKLSNVSLSNKQLFKPKM